MRRFLFIMCVTLVSGCQSVPPPPSSPGLASLRVQVVAEPKVGSKMAAQGGSRAPGVYDDASNTPARGTGSGAYETVDYSNVEDVIVSLEPLEGSGGSTSAPLTVDVGAAKAGGGIAAASVGQKIVLRNAGARPSDIYSVSDGNEFDFKGVAAGSSVEYVVRSPGLIEVLTDPSKDPAARVYAAPSRWVARTRSGRDVDFVDVVPGRYAVVAWHPRLPGARAEMNLAADRRVKVTLEIGVNALPKAGAPAPAR
jgi:hypothetical protein